MHYPPGFHVTHHDSGVVVYPHVYADSIVPRKLDDRVVCDDGENKNRRAVLDFNDGESNLALGEPLVVEVEDQPVPRAF